MTVRTLEVTAGRSRSGRSRSTWKVPTVTVVSSDPRPQVHRAAPADGAHIAAVLGRAFFADPVLRWVVPDDLRRRRLLPDLFAVYTTTFLRFHEITVDTNGAGAALWAPPGQSPVPEEMADEFGRRIEEVLGADTQRVLEVVALLDQQRPPGLHCYLQLLGVDPEWRGVGIGSALVTAVLDRCAREGLPACLEATSPRNRRLYERLGFRAHGELAPAGGPPLWPMRWDHRRQSVDQVRRG